MTPPTNPPSGAGGMVALNDIVVERRFRVDLGELSDLAASIARLGFCTP